METPKTLVQEIEKQLESIRERLSEIASERKQLSKQSKALTLTLRLSEPAKATRKGKAKKRVQKHFPAPATG
jgi:hypothetical protein